MIGLDTVLIKVASRCNINCKYCYVYNMGDDRWRFLEKIISDETLKKIKKSFVDLVKKQSTPFAVTLHGGEPLLLGKKKLSKILSLFREALDERYPIRIQTNGILLTPSFLDIFAEFNAELSVSIDGPAHIHDEERINFQGKGTHKQVEDAIQLLNKHPRREKIFAGILSVINPNSNPNEIYQYFKTLSPPSIDFLYRDGNHSRLPTYKKSFTSTEYGQWLAELSEIYIQDQNPIKIRILDDLLKLLMGGRSTKEGLGINSFGIVIIDTDGSITKNDTLKSNYKGADRFKENWSIHTSTLCDLLESKEFVNYHAMQTPTSEKCLSCKDLHVCGATMLLHRWKDENGYDNPSIYCNDQIFIISYLKNKLEENRIVKHVQH